MNKDSLKKSLALLLKIGVTAAALFFLYWQLDWPKLVELLGASRWAAFIPAFLLYMLSKVASAIRLNDYFRGIGLQISPIQNLKLYWLGMFYNFFLPGGIGGDGYKVFLLNKKRGASVKLLTGAVVLDRAIGVMALGLMLLALAPLLPLALPWRWAAWLVLPLGVFAGFWLLGWLWPKHMAGRTKGILLSLFVQVLQILSVAFVAYAFRYDDSQLSLAFVFMVSSVVSALPISIGGLGAREATFFLGAEWLALDPNKAVAIAFGFYLLNVFSSLAGLYYHIRKIDWNEPAKQIEK